MSKGKVTVLGPNGGPLTVIFNGAGLAGTTASPLVMVGAGGSYALISAPPATSANVLANGDAPVAQSEVQILTFGSKPRGTFTLTMNGQQTAPIAYVDDSDPQR